MNFTVRKMGKIFGRNSCRNNRKIFRSGTGQTAKKVLKIEI